MLAFIPPSSLSAHQSAYAPYTSVRDDDFRSDFRSELANHYYGLDERSLYEAYLRRQAHEATVLRRRHALEEEARQREHAQAIADAKLVALASALQQHQDGLRRRAYAEAQRRNGLIARQREQIEYVKLEQERLERVRRYAALQDLQARKRHLAEALLRARNKGSEGDRILASQQMDQPIKRVRFSMDERPDDWLSPRRSYAVHNGQRESNLSTGPTSVHAEHAHEVPGVDQFLKDRLRTEQDAEVIETVQSALAHLLGVSPTSIKPATATAEGSSSPVAATREASAPAVESFQPSPCPASSSSSPLDSATQTSPTFPPTAAEKLLFIYQAYCARRTALASLSSISSALDTLSSSFIFPEHLDFTPSDCESTSDAASDAGSEASSTLSYSAANKPLHVHEQALAELLTKLDAVQSNGDAKVRAERKRLVKKVEDALAAMDELVEEARKKHEAESALEPLAGSPPTINNPKTLMDVDPPHLTHSDASLNNLDSSLNTNDLTTSLANLCTLDEPSSAPVTVQALVDNLSQNSAGASITSGKVDTP